jgi:hypothetical protein
LLEEVSISCREEMNMPCGSYLHLFESHQWVKLSQTIHLIFSPLRWWTIYNLLLRRKPTILQAYRLNRSAREVLLIMTLPSTCVSP